MTSIREEFLSTRFNEFLDRFSPPRRIASDFDAQQREADAMLRMVLKYAPADAYPEFLDRVLTQLQEGMKTRAWPTTGELAGACKAFAAKRQVATDATASRDDAQIAADRMARGDVVGESWLFGICAVELEERSLVDAGVLRRYRRAAFLGRKATYGEESALRWREEREAAHDAARAAYRSRDEVRQYRDVTVPDMTDKPGWGVAAE